MPNIMEQFGDKNVLMVGAIGGIGLGVILLLRKNASSNGTAPQPFPPAWWTGGLIQGGNQSNGEPVPAPIPTPSPTPTPSPPPDPEPGPIPVQHCWPWQDCTHPNPNPNPQPVIHCQPGYHLENGQCVPDNPQWYGVPSIRSSNSNAQYVGAISDTRSAMMVM